MNLNPFFRQLAILALAHLSHAAEISWDTTHPVLIKADAHYGRMARIDDGTLIAGYDFQRAIHVSFSHDEGKTWEAPIKVATGNDGNCTNTELCVLKNGEILCCYNFRPNKGTKVPFSIHLTRSRDGGKTWCAPEQLYAAGENFEDGCWEPSCIQLPDGEVQVYFANESPYRKSNEQEISMIRSGDNGHVWGKPETVSFRKHSRDGMPVPVVARNGNAIAVAIEDNGLSGQFKPVIVTTRLERGGWHHGAVDAESPFRWGALAKPLAASTYAGAPYLRQFSSGQFVISFQMAESGDIKQSRMAVSLGNDRARGFGDPSFPFPDTLGRAQLWNALFIKNDRTITAISETSVNGVRGIWSVNGELRP